MISFSSMRFWKDKKRSSKRQDFPDAKTSSSTDSTASSNSPPPADGSFPRPPSPPPLSTKESSLAPTMMKSSPRSSQARQSVKTTVSREGKKSDSSTSSSSCLNEDDTLLKQAAALDSVANSLLEKGDYPRAIQTYERALELKRMSLKSSSAQPRDDLMASVATSINNISYLRQRSGNGTPQECLHAYQDSLLIKREILGDDSLAVGKTLNNIGSVHYSCRQYTQALDSYQEALTIMQHQLGNNHLDVATVFSNIGDVYMAIGKRQTAHDEYKSALDIRWMHLKGNSPKICRLLEKIAIIEMNQEYNNTNEENEDRILEEEVDLPSMFRELHNLHTEVEADIRNVSTIRRQVALDMVKDKLRILKEMKNMGGGNTPNDADDGNESVQNVPPKTPPPPLSPMERSEALSSVKSRLAKLREQRAITGGLYSSHASNNAAQEEEDARLERELGLEHLQLPQLNLDSILGS